MHCLILGRPGAPLWSSARSAGRPRGRTWAESPPGRYSATRHAQMSCLACTAITSHFQHTSGCVIRLISAPQTTQPCGACMQQPEARRCWLVHAGLRAQQNSCQLQIQDLQVQGEFKEFWTHTSWAAPCSRMSAMADSQRRPYSFSPGKSAYWSKPRYGAWVFFWLDKKRHAPAGLRHATGCQP